LGQKVKKSKGYSLPFFSFFCKNIFFFEFSSYNDLKSSRDIKIVLKRCRLPDDVIKRHENAKFAFYIRIFEEFNQIMRQPATFLITVSIPP